jgi:hypothetical protein
LIFETTALQGRNGMTDESIRALHLVLNAPRFNGLKHFRRNHDLYRITAPMNCLVSCVLSHNLEMIPVLVQRCRSKIAAVGATVAAIEEATLRVEYLDLV